MPKLTGQIRSFFTKPTEASNVGRADNAAGALATPGARQLDAGAAPQIERGTARQALSPGLRAPASVEDIVGSYLLPADLAALDRTSKQSRALVGRQQQYSADEMQTIRDYAATFTRRRALETENARIDANPRWYEAPRDGASSARKALHDVARRAAPGKTVARQMDTFERGATLRDEKIALHKKLDPIVERILINSRPAVRALFAALAELKNAQGPDAVEEAFAKLQTKMLYPPDIPCDLSSQLERMKTIFTHDRHRKLQLQASLASDALMDALRQELVGKH